MEIIARDELPKLKAMLAQAMAKVDKWTGEDKQAITREHLADQEQMENTQRELDEKSLRLKALQRDLAGISQSLDSQVQEKEVVGQEILQTNLSITKEQGMLTSGQEKAEDNLNQAADMFTERLGLTFKKTTGDRLQMVFRDIDHKEPSSPFYFYVKVVDGKYEITDCEPEVPDLDSLVEKLNKTNNFRSFVIAVRKRFKKLVT